MDRNLSLIGLLIVSVTLMTGCRGSSEAHRKKEGVSAIEKPKTFSVTLGKLGDLFKKGNGAEELYFTYGDLNKYRSRLTEQLNQMTVKITSPRWKNENGGESDFENPELEVVGDRRVIIKKSSERDQDIYISLKSMEFCGTHTDNTNISGFGLIKLFHVKFTFVTDKIPAKTGNGKNGGIWTQESTWFTSPTMAYNSEGKLINPKAYLAKVRH